MLADSMEANSNVMLNYLAGTPTLDFAWRKPDAGKAYTEKNLKNISPKLMAEEEKLRERLPVNPFARFERRRFMLSEDMADTAFSRIRDLMNVPFRHLQYNYHKESGEYFVKVIDDETDEVVREIPSEKLLDIFACLKEIVGLLFDERR